MLQNLLNVAIPKKDKKFSTDALITKLSLNNEPQKSFTLH